MNNDLATFDFGGENVRVIHIDGQPWWVASDLAKVLGYSHTPSMLRMLDEDQKGVHEVYTLGGPQQTSIVNESGMWACVIRSKRPEAKAFQRLLTGTILPALRRDGFYALPGALIGRPASVAELLRTSDALKKERHPATRAALWAHMDRICDSWSVPRITHGAIGFSDPDYSQVLEEFWRAIDGLAENGFAVNHSRKNSLIALNLPQVRELFQEVGVPIEIDADLRQALRQSQSPGFIADKIVNCRDDKRRQCWVFSQALLLENAAATP